MRSDGVCSSCGAPIRWARSASTKKRMPLDPRPDPNGNIGVVEWEGEAPNRPLPVVAVNPTRAVTRYRYLSHFVTCPNAGKHRR